ncbi:unnamed protein product [Mytilus coruscus]|uniref:Uncharacterized protein n=1 Tax=Mytilus coruscus TaxID=42192 RepID=A0A6J8CIB4_MYTCO|nr:unnamed protein product [Mytilus coruscus]
MKSKKKRALKYIVAAIAAKRRTKKVKRNWTKPWLTRKADLGVCQTLLKELSNEDSDSFRNFLRVSPQQFAYLLDMYIIKDSITNGSTNMRTCITAEERLSLTLRYLATETQTVNDTENGQDIGTGLLKVPRGGSRNSCQARQIRDEFKEYFFHYRPRSMAGKCC